MEPNFSFLYHQASKGRPPGLLNSNGWPEEWKTVYYKAYHRLPKISLLEEVKSEDPHFFETIGKRKSATDFTSHSLNLLEISHLLRYSCGNVRVSKDGGSMRRVQPSAGARYPIEIYPLVLRGTDGIKPGLYHYNVKAHALDVLWEREFLQEELSGLFSYDWVHSTSVVFLMTAVFHRNQMKYGERGYRYILIEAGHIGQNLYLVSEALELKCSALGGTNDEAIEKLLDIDGVGESLVYAVAVGK